MNLIDAPIETQEQNDDYATHDAANALREAEDGWQYKLPFVAGNCFEEFTRRRQPGQQRVAKNIGWHSARFWRRYF